MFPSGTSLKEYQRIFVLLRFPSVGGIIYQKFRQLNLFANVQITPWVHTEVSIGLNGLGVVLRIDSKNVSYDLEVKGRWGLFALLFLPQVSVSGYGTGIPAY